MTKLNLHPTYIKLTDVPPDVQHELVKAFTWEDERAKFMVSRHRKQVHKVPQKWCVICRDGASKCLYENNILPIGFQDRLHDLLGGWGVPYEAVDCRTPKPSRQYQWHYDFELRDYQREIVDAILDSQYGVIEAATGSGKTVVAAAAVAELGVPTIILTPTKVVWNQFWELFSTKTDIPIGRLASGRHEDAPVQIAITKSLVNEDGTSKQEYLQGKQLILIDEWHQGASKTWGTVINDCPAYYRFGFSATPFRATDLECNMLAGMCGETIASIGTEELQAEGFLCQTDIRIVPVDVLYDRETFDERKPEGSDEPIGLRETTFAERYREGIVENAERNIDIAQAVWHHYEAGDKVLVIVAWTDHAEGLLPMLPEDTIFLSGKDTPKQTKDKADAFRQRSGGVLLGSPVVDVGFDVPACDVVVMAGGGRYDGRQRQRLGRGLRPSPGKDVVVIYDFNDDDRDTGGRPMFYQHSQARIKAYRDVGQSVHEYSCMDHALTSGLKLGV